MYVYNRTSERATRKKPQGYGYLEGCTKRRILKKKRKEKKWKIPNADSIDATIESLHHNASHKKNQNARSVLKIHSSYVQELLYLYQLVSQTDDYTGNYGESSMRKGHTHQPYLFLQIPAIHRIKISSRSAQHRRRQRKEGNHLFVSLAYEPVNFIIRISYIEVLYIPA